MIQTEKQLTVEDVVRAWEDAHYRENLTQEQREELPTNPAGEIVYYVPETSHEAALTEWRVCDTYSRVCETYTCAYSLR